MSARGYRFNPTVIESLLLSVILSVSLSEVMAQAPQTFSPCQQARAQIQEGERWLDEKRYPNALQAFRAAVALCPENLTGALELTRAYLAARRFPEAEESAKSLLAKDPQSEPAQLFLANSYFMQQRFQEAGQTLQKLLAQDNSNADAHKLMGVTLFFYKEYVTAERELLIALRLHPKDEEALYYLGRIYYAQNTFRPALTVFRRLVRANPSSYKAYDNLGLTLEALGHTEEAIAAFKKAQELARQADPTYDWPFGNLAEMLIKENRTEEALPYAREAARINPQSARNHYLVGKALSRTENPQESLDELRKAAELDPNYPEPHYLLGQLYQKLRRRAEAEREFALFQKISKETAQKKQ